MIKVTLEFTSIAEAVAFLTQAPKTGKLTVTEGNEKPADKPAAVKADKPASTDSSPKPAESPATPAAADTSKGETPAASALDYLKDVRPLVIKVGAAGKRDNLVELLKKFGVEKGPDVPADKLPAFKADLEALVAA